MGKEIKIPDSLLEFSAKTGVTLDAEYQGSLKKSKWLCQKGHAFEIDWKHLKKRNIGCLVCNNKQKVSYADVKLVIEKDGKHFLKTLENDYKNTTEPLEIECFEYNDILFKNYKTFNKHGCSLCNPKQKHSLESVKAEASKFGYKVLSTTFKSCKDYIDLECPNGHLYKVKWYSFYSNGKRCLCRKSDNFFKEIQIKAFERGYTIPDQDFINVTSPIDMICPEGHFVKMRWSNFLARDQECEICSPNQPTYEMVQKFIQDKNFSLISTEYVNNHTPLHLRCAEGHDWHVPYGNFIQRSTAGCPVCIGTIKNYTIEGCKELAAAENYILYSDIYAGSNHKMSWRCDKGHEYKSTWSSFVAGHRCPVCGNSVKNELSTIKAIAAKEGYKILSTDYKNSKTKLDFECPNGHSFDMRWNDFNNNNRCWVCWQDSSIPNRAEQELIDFMHTLNIQPQTLDRTILPNRQELDLYIPDLKLGIEYCGIYWHSDAVMKNKNKHLEKLKLCKSLGINLLTIFEDEWLHKKEIVKNIIKYKVGKFDHVVYARKCSIKLLEKEKAKEFLEKYHLQGKTRGTFYGLYSDDELIQVMGFSQHHRQTIDSSTLVLNRFCTKGGYRVVGGASKLFKHAMIELKPKQIITYADLRWSDGNLYHQLGFKEEAILQPDYSYVKGLFRYSKQSLKKTEAEKSLDKTEQELRIEQGYHRIWDCGKLKFGLCP